MPSKTDAKSLAVGLALLGLSLCPSAARAEAPAALLAIQGIQQYQQGDMAEAARLLALACSRAPEHLAAAHHLGLALARLGRLPESRRELARAVRLSPADARLHLDAGLVYLAEGNAVWAARSLGRARELAPRSWAAAHYLGVALLAMDASEEAAEALGATKKLDRAKEETSLQLALALFRAKELEGSRSVLEPLLLGQRGALARRLMRATHDAAGVPASLVSGSVAVGGLVDENPLYEHDASGAMVFGLTLAGSVIVRPWMDSANLVWGDVGVSRTFYFPTEQSGGSPDAGDVASTGLSAGLTYVRILSAAPDAWLLGASYRFDLVFLDGFDQLFEDGTPPVADGNHIFMERHGGHLTLERRASDGGSTRLRYSMEREVFAHYPRSNLGLELSLEHGLTVLSDRLRLLFWIYGRYRMAERDYYNALAMGQGVGGSLLLPLDIVLGLSAACEFQRFPDSAQGPWKHLREDHQAQLAAELGRSFPLGFRLWAAYTRDWRPSTVSSFDIRRHMASLNLSWRYP